MVNSNIPETRTEIQSKLAAIAQLAQDIRVMADFLPDAEGSSRPGVKNLDDRTQDSIYLDDHICIIHYTGKDGRSYELSVRPGR